MIDHILSAVQEREAGCDIAIVRSQQQEWRFVK